MWTSLQQRQRMLQRAQKRAGDGRWRRRRSSACLMMMMMTAAQSDLNTVLSARATTMTCMRRCLLFDRIYHEAAMPQQSFNGSLQVFFSHMDAISSASVTSGTTQTVQDHAERHDCLLWARPFLACNAISSTGHHKAAAVVAAVHLPLTFFNTNVMCCCASVAGSLNDKVPPMLNVMCRQSMHALPLVILTRAPQGSGEGSGTTAADILYIETIS